MYKTTIRSFVFLSLLFSFSSSNAITWSVCSINCDYTSIAAGVIASSPGDTLELQDASYTENNIFINKDLTIESTSLAGRSTIDATGLGRIFRIDAGIVAELINLNLINGTAAAGGAIYLGNSASANVKNVIFRNNFSALSGGAVELSSNASLHTNLTTFQSNSSSGSGGAVYCDGCATIDVSHTIFNNNRSTTLNGGAISILPNIFPTPSYVTIEKSKFTSNLSASDGGAIYTEGLISLKISSSTFESNRSGLNGGAIAATQDAAQIKIDKSTFNNNTTDLGSGGAIKFENINWGGARTDINIYNSTFSRNNAQVAGGAISEFASKLFIEYSTFYENIANIPVQPDVFDGLSFKLTNSIVHNVPGSLPCSSSIHPTSAGNLIDDPSLTCTPAPIAPTNISPTLSINGAGIFGTQTHRILPASNAVDAAIGACTWLNGLTISNDQRGRVRPSGVNCDVGAFEL